MNSGRAGKPAALRALLAAGLVMLFTAVPAAADLFIVTAPCVSLLIEPGGSLAGGMATNNVIGAVEDRSGDWVQVRLAGGQTGWLPLSAGRYIGGEPVPAGPGGGKDEAVPPASTVVSVSVPPAQRQDSPARSAAPPVAVRTGATPAAAQRVAAVTAPAQPVRPAVAAPVTRPQPARPAVVPVSHPEMPHVEVEFFLRTDATLRVSRGEISMPAGAALIMVPGDERTRRAMARGDLTVLCRTTDGILQPLGPGGQWRPATGQYIMVITGAQLRAPARVRVNVTGPTGPANAPSSNNAPEPATGPDTVGAATQFDGSTLYRGVRVAPGSSLTQLAAAWGAPDQQYHRQGNRYYQFGPVTLQADPTDPDRVSELILGSGWSVLGVQPGMMLAEVAARWGAPFMPPMPMAAGGWRCGWLRDGFVLSCSLAGPQGPVNELSVARR